ncbi:hypothetical protein ABT061_12920 [Streptosporangium sp. NPDC002544]|uniref:hypothetical protein n=1 Tax=Streptosporangium sp. NPDC002544 TaxID=3154538 RepID=UPI003330311A
MILTWRADGGKVRAQAVQATVDESTRRRLERIACSVLDILCNIFLTWQYPSRASRTASDENAAGQPPSLSCGPTLTLSRAMKRQVSASDLTLKVQ